MAMPQIPESKHRPNLENTVIDLLESIAYEELALSNIINSEAEKVLAFVGKESNFPLCSSSSDIIEFNLTTNNMMETIIMKEWLLLRKLDKVSHIDFTRGYKEDEKDVKEIEDDYTEETDYSIIDELDSE